MLTGIFSTLLLPETKGFSLEDLSNENQEGELAIETPSIRHVCSRMLIVFLLKQVSFDHLPTTVPTVTLVKKPLKARKFLTTFKERITL